MDRSAPASGDNGRDRNPVFVCVCEWKIGTSSEKMDKKFCVSDSENRAQYKIVEQ